MAETERRGGWNRKSIKQHKLDGTFKKSVHGHREEVERLPPLCNKPKVQRKPPGASRKWIRNASDRRAIKRGCWFDFRLGRYAVKWIETHLVLTEGEFAGKPFKLMPWQRDLVMRLFSWVRWDSDRNRVVRRFRKAFIFIAKKNGKTPLAAAIGLYMFCGDSLEQGQHVYIAATDKIQASLAASHAIKMIDASSVLSARVQCNATMMKATYHEQNSVLRVVPGQAHRLEGLNACCIIKDEVHAWVDERVWNALRFATAGRPEPLDFAITTAGSEMESVCRRQYEYAQGVATGSIMDDEFLGLIYEASPLDNWKKKETWIKANPALGSILHLDELRAACAEAKQSPKMESVFKRYRLNLWVASESPWLNLNQWLNCSDKYESQDLHGQPCYGGLDLAKTKDTTALSLLFSSEDGDSYRQLVWFWLPEETAMEREHLASFREWVDLGILKLTPGNVCDYNVVFNDVKEIVAQFQVQGIAFDPYNAESITQRIESELGIERIAFAQTIKNIHPAASEFERCVLNGTMLHNSNGLLTWQASNVQIRHDHTGSGNIRPTKRHASDYRTIDGIMASIMALGLSLTHSPAPKTDYYDSHNLELV